MAMKVIGATALFAAVHSLLASRRVKARFETEFPRRQELYRVLYNAQSLVTFGALTAYIAAQPKRTLYELHGVPAAALRIGQWSGVLFAVAAARATGVTMLAGLETKPPSVPAAQGPELHHDGALRVEGPFTIVRHPLNLAPLAPFWLTPHMTTRRLAFNCIATLYLVAGSLHEEQRLLAQYGDAYRQYQESGVPFYIPRFFKSAS